MRRVTTATNDLFIFDDMADMTAYTNPNDFEYRGKSWVGEDVKSYADAKYKLEHAWAEGLKTLEEFVKRLCNEQLPEVKHHQRRVRFNEYEGDEICYDRLRNGQEFWRQSVREETRGPNELTIFIDTATSASVDHKDILWRGAVGIALAKLLEDAGYRVEVWMITGSMMYRDKYNMKVNTAACLKRCSDPLDISTLVNAVSGWYFRSAVFCTWDTLIKKVGERKESVYGRPCSLTDTQLDAISQDEMRVYCTGVWSFDAALNMIKAELKKVIER